MRLLIANDIEPVLTIKPDVRAWTQRMLWLAGDGDVIVTMCEPDPMFLQYVTELTGVDRATLTFCVIPGRRNPGEYGERMFDPLALHDPEFITGVAACAGAATEIIAAWPSPELPAFAEALGLAHALPGAAFLGQFGGELANNKAVFRALSSGAGIPIASGAVCRSAADAVRFSRELLSRASAVMVKKAHGGAGGGNYLLVKDDTDASGHAGARAVREVATVAALADFWSEEWAWASHEDQFPVVIETLVPEARSIYAEFACEDAGTRLQALGELVFEEGTLVREITPLRLDDATIEEQLVAGGESLARLYQGLGYRGWLSADGVVASNGEVNFTEVNCRMTGSTHLYSAIAGIVVRAQDSPVRTVTQVTTPTHWQLPGFSEFLGLAGDLNVLYDPKRRTGCLISAPMTAEFGPTARASGRCLLAVAHETAGDLTQVLETLDHALSRATTSDEPTVV